MRQGGELAAGLAAAAAFILLLVLLTPAQFIWAALLAFGVYLGVRFLVSSGKVAPPSVEKPVAPIQKLEDIGPLGARLPTDLRQKVYYVRDSAQVLLQDVENRPDRQADIYIAVAQYLELLQMALMRYLETVRPDAAPQSRQLLEQLLSGIQRQFSTLHTSLVQEDDAATASELSALNQTLEEMNELLQPYRAADETQTLRVGGGRGDRQ